MRTEKQYICDRIWEYAEKDRESLKRVYDFMVVNCIHYLEEASLKALEFVFRIETFMDVEKQGKNKVEADFEEATELQVKIREREDVDIIRARDWVWMPHAAHFIASNSCRFRMATVVGDFVVSTVGDNRSWGKGEKLEVGCDRFYETMIFFAKKDNGNECDCCQYVISGDGLETIGYNDSKSAFDGHMEMCNKYARMEAVK